MIGYYRGGGFPPPPDNERLEISDDGTFTLWRSLAAATAPLTPVGRFAGSLEPAVYTALRQAAADAATAGDLELELLPDAARETTRVEGACARMGAWTEPDGPWGVLLKQLRPLLGTLTRFPVAAIDIEVSPDYLTGHLFHLGPEPLRLMLSRFSLTAVCWENGRVVARWMSPDYVFYSMSDVTATPGWSLDLPFAHNFHLSPATRVTVYATFDAWDDGSVTTVKVQNE